MTDPKQILSGADKRDMNAYAAVMRGLPFSEDGETSAEDSMFESAARRQELLNEIDRLEVAQKALK
jgi:hypothetical protein